MDKLDKTLESAVFSVFDEDIKAIQKRYKYLFENYSFQYKIAKIVCILPFSKTTSRKLM